MATSEPAEPYSTTAEVAVYLNKPESWVYDNAGPLGLPRYKLGKQYRYRLSEVAAWMDGKRDWSTPATGRQLP